MTTTIKTHDEYLAEYVERTKEELQECVDQLPTAAEVIELFERFTMHLHTIGEWVDSLGLAAEEGIMVDEVQRLQRLIAGITIGVGGVAYGRVCMGYDAAATTAMSLVTMITRGAQLASATGSKTRDPWYWPTSGSAHPRPIED